MYHIQVWNGEDGETYCGLGQYERSMYNWLLSLRWHMENSSKKNFLTGTACERCEFAVPDLHWLAAVDLGDTQEPVVWHELCEEIGI